MKKISTLLIILLVFITSKSQDLPKGTTLLGGTIGFCTTTEKSLNQEDLRVTGISLNPSIGKFYRNNRVAGITLHYSRTTATNHSSEGDFYGVGFFLRQYVSFGRSFYLFAEENIQGQAGESKQEYNSGMARVYSKQRYVSINVYPGLAYAITTKFQAELSLNNLLSLAYRHSDRTEANNQIITQTNSRKFSFNAGNNMNQLGYLSVGVKWLFARR